MQNSIIKEEIDIPFDQADNLLDQIFTYYNKTLANDEQNYRHTSNDTHVVVKTKPCQVNIKMEPELLMDADSIDENVDMAIKIEPVDFKMEFRDVMIPYNVKDEPSEEVEPQNLMDKDRAENVDEEEKDVHVTTESDPVRDKLIVEASKVPNAIVLVERLRVMDTLKIGEKKSEKRRILRQRKAKNLGADFKDLNRRTLRKRVTKNAATVEKLPKLQKNEIIKSHFSSLIRQKCPNCKLAVELDSQVMPICSYCQTLCVYECTKCKRQYDKKNAIKIHVDTRCAPRKIHACKLCDYTTTNLSHIKRHVVRKHNANMQKLSDLFESNSTLRY